MIVNNLNSSIAAVLFPKMSEEQDDRQKIKATTRNSIRFSALILCPMMLGLAAVSDSFVRLLLTEKWLPCVPLMQLFCIIYLFQPIHTANMQAIKAMGRSDIYLRLEIVKKAVELVVLLVTMWISVDAMVIGMAVCATLFVFVNAYPNIKLLDYSIREQLADILPPVVISLIMEAAVVAVGLLPLPVVIKLIVQVLAGAILYFAMTILTRNREMKQLLQILRKGRKKA